MTSLVSPREEVRRAKFLDPEKRRVSPSNFDAFVLQPARLDTLASFFQSSTKKVGNIFVDSSFGRASSFRVKRPVDVFASYQRKCSNQFNLLPGTKLTACKLPVLTAGDPAGLNVDERNCNIRSVKKSRTKLSTADKPNENTGQTAGLYPPHRAENVRSAISYAITSRILQSPQRTTNAINLHTDQEEKVKQVLPAIHTESGEDERKSDDSNRKRLISIRPKSDVKRETDVKHRHFNDASITKQPIVVTKTTNGTAVPVRDDEIHPDYLPGCSTSGNEQILKSKILSALKALSRVDAGDFTSSSAEQIQSSLDRQAMSFYQIYKQSGNNAANTYSHESHSGGPKEANTAVGSRTMEGYKKVLQSSAKTFKDKKSAAYKHPLLYREQAAISLYGNGPTHEAGSRRPLSSPHVEHYYFSPTLGELQKIPTLENGDPPDIVGHKRASDHARVICQTTEARMSSDRLRGEMFKSKLNSQLNSKLYKLSHTKSPSGRAFSSEDYVGDSVYSHSVSPYEGERRISPDSGLSSRGQTPLKSAVDDGFERAQSTGATDTDVYRSGTPIETAIAYIDGVKGTSELTSNIGIGDAEQSSAQRPTPNSKKPPLGKSLSRTSVASQQPSSRAHPKITTVSTKVMEIDTVVSAPKSSKMYQVPWASPVKKTAKKVLPVTQSDFAAAQWLLEQKAIIRQKTLAKERAARFTEALRDAERRKKELAAAARSASSTAFRDIGRSASFSDRESAQSSTDSVLQVKSIDRSQSFSDIGGSSTGELGEIERDIAKAALDNLREAYGMFEELYPVVCSTAPSTASFVPSNQSVTLEESANQPKEEDASRHSAPPVSSPTSDVPSDTVVSSHASVEMASMTVLLPSSGSQVLSSVGSSYQGDLSKPQNTGAQTEYGHESQDGSNHHGACTTVSQQELQELASNYPSQKILEVRRKRPPVRPLPPHLLPRVANISSRRGAVVDIAGYNKLTPHECKEQKSLEGVQTAESGVAKKKTLRKSEKFEHGHAGDGLRQSTQLPPEKTKDAKDSNTSSQKFSSKILWKVNSSYPEQNRAKSSTLYVRSQTQAFPAGDGKPIVTNYHVQNAPYDSLTGYISSYLTSSRPSSVYGDRPGEGSSNDGARTISGPITVPTAEQLLSTDESVCDTESLRMHSASTVADDNYSNEIANDNVNANCRHGEPSSLRIRDYLRSFRSPITGEGFDVETLFDGNTPIRHDIGESDFGDDSSSESEATSDNEEGAHVQTEADRTEIQDEEEFNQLYNFDQIRPEKLDDIPVQTFAPGDRRKYDFDALNVYSVNYEFADPFSSDLASIDVMSMARQKKNWKQQAQKIEDDTEFKIMDRLYSIARLVVDTEEYEQMQKDKRKRNTAIKKLSSRVKDTIRHQSAKLRERKCQPDCVTPLCIGQCALVRSTSCGEFNATRACKFCGEEGCKGLCSKTVYEGRARTTQPIPNAKPPKVTLERPKSCNSCRKLNNAKLINTRNVFQSVPMLYNSTYASGQHLSTTMTPHTHPDIDKETEEKLFKLGIEPDQVLRQPKDSKPPDDRFKPTTDCSGSTRGRVNLSPGKSFFSQRRHSLTDRPPLQKVRRPSPTPSLDRIKENQ